MDDRANRVEWLSAAECADRLGLTVRALRLYEQRGLIAPRRTPKGWRLYGADEIARLHEILALKRLGLSLLRIGTLLKGHAINLDRTLQMQQAALLEQRASMEQSLQLLNAARAKLASGAALSTHELIDLARETTMTPAASSTIAWRRYEQARPRTETPVNPALLDKYVGWYQFDFAGMMEITRDQNRLLAQLTAQHPYEIFAEAEHKFFYKIVPAQITFSVSKDGVADSLTLHQNGFELLAKRISAAAAEAAKGQLAARIAANQPMPESETILRDAIVGLQKGEIDCSRMSESLAALVREQAPVIGPELSALGALNALSFRRVGKGGSDVYVATFEKGKTEWRINLAENGTITGLRVSDRA